MKFTYQCLSWLAISVLACGSIGCGNQICPVQGKITLDGKPMVGGGSIAFVPIGGQKGKAAGGEIKEDGTYTLTTNSPGDGSMLGEFKVVITQSTAKEPEATPDGKAPSEPVVLPASDHIPAIYSSHDSPLRATVEAKSLNEIHLDLKRSAGKSSPPPGA
jgi:hypothetical protein